MGRGRTLVRAVAPCLSVVCCSLSVLFPVRPSDCLSVLFPSSYLYFLFPVYLIRRLSVCLVPRLYVLFPIRPSVWFPVFLSVCLVPCLPVCMSSSLSCSLSVCLSVLFPLCLHICMSCSLSVYLVHYLFVCPFVTLDGGSAFYFRPTCDPKDCEPLGKMTADCVIRSIPFTIDRA